MAADTHRSCTFLHPENSSAYRGLSVFLWPVVACYVLFVAAKLHDGHLDAARAMYGGISDAQTRDVGFAPFMYPPTAFLALAPLAPVPPPAFFNVMYGQNGFLIAGLPALALYRYRQRLVRPQDAAGCPTTHSGTRSGAQQIAQ